MWAADHGHSDTCKLLLEAKAKINLQDFVSLTWLFLWRLDLCAKNVDILHTVHSLLILSYGFSTASQHWFEQQGVVMLKPALSFWIQGPIFMLCLH